MMVPVGRLIVLRSTPKPELARAIAYISWPGLAAFVIGPPIGGFITTYASWHWIFLLNLPIGAVAFTLALLWIENTRTPLDEHHPFDWLTFVPAGIASTTFVIALERLGGDSAHYRFPIAMLLLSLASGAAALMAARRSPHSFIDLESMRLRSFSLSVYGASLFRIAVSVVPFLLPLMFQISFGLNAFTSGLYLLALFAGDFAMKSAVIQILRRFGFRRILIVNGLLTTFSLLLCATLSPSTPPVLILTILFFQRRIQLHGVHLPQHPRLHRDSRRADEPRQRLPLRGHAALARPRRRRWSPHPSRRRHPPRTLRSHAATRRLPLRAALHRPALSRSRHRLPRPRARRWSRYQRTSPHQNLSRLTRCYR